MRRFILNTHGAGFEAQWVTLLLRVSLFHVSAGKSTITLLSTQLPAHASQATSVSDLYHPHGRSTWTVRLQVSSVLPWLLCAFEQWTRGQKSQSLSLPPTLPLTLSSLIQTPSLCLSSTWKWTLKNHTGSNAKPINNTLSFYICTLLLKIRTFLKGYLHMILVCNPIVWSQGNEHLAGVSPI